MKNKILHSTIIFALFIVFELYYKLRINYSYAIASFIYFLALSGLLITVRIIASESKILRYGIALLLAGIVSQFIQSLKFVVPVECNYYLFALLATIALYIEFKIIHPDAT